MVHQVGPRTGHARIAEPSKQLRSQERHCLLIASETPASIANSHAVNVTVISQLA
jgi:hypothetical protein